MPYHGDFVSPEQMIPPNGIQDVNGEDLVWESCVTMNNNWGYCAETIISNPLPCSSKKLVECVSKGGNMLLNVGPDAKGNIPIESMEILYEIGRWMKKNKESIYGCSKAGIEKPDFGRVTRKGNHLYFHIYGKYHRACPSSRIQKRRGKRHPLSGDRGGDSNLRQLGAQRLPGYRICKSWPRPGAFGCCRYSLGCSVEMTRT